MIVEIILLYTEYSYWLSELASLFEIFASMCVFKVNIPRGCFIFVFLFSLQTKHYWSSVQPSEPIQRGRWGECLHMGWIWVVFLLSDSLLPYLSYSLAATKILLRFLLNLHTGVIWSFKGLQFNRSLLLPNLPLKWKYKALLHRRECCIQSFTVPVMWWVISSSVYMVSSSSNLHCVSNLQTVTVALLLRWVHCKLPLAASKPCHMVVYYWLTLGFALFLLPLPPQRTVLTHHSAFAMFIQTGAFFACSEQAVWK